MTTEISLAIAEMKAEVAADLEGSIRRGHDRMIKEHGPKLRGIYNSRDAGFYHNTILPTLSQSEDAVIDEARLAAFVTAAADLAAAQCEAKVVAKIGPVTDVKVSDFDGRSFSVHGKIGDHEVSIVQQMILNVSSKGMVFNQFPARIRLDGKAISEAAYKRTAA